VDAKSGKPGAVWAAQRVPDDHVAVCPNESRIGEIDLSNPDLFMASVHAESFAVESGSTIPRAASPSIGKGPTPPPRAAP